MYKSLILSIVFITLFSSKSTAQILNNSSLNLNAGGAIYDVVYDPYYKAYILVGNFDSIGGYARNNFAMIDANSLNVLSTNPISNINGEIRCVEIVRDISNQYNYLFLGGNFNNVNGQSRNYIARFRIPTDGVLGAAYTLTNWVPLDVTFYPGSSMGVNDMTSHNDTLVVVGEFLYNDPPGFSGILLENIVALKAFTSNITLTGTFIPSMNTDRLYSIEYWNNKYLVAGQFINGGSDDYLKYHSLNGTVISDLALQGTIVDDARHFIAEQDSHIIYNSEFGSAENDNLTGLDLSGSQVSQAMGNYGDIAIYQSKVFGLNWINNSLSILLRNPNLGATNFFTVNNIHQLNNISVPANAGSFLRTQAYRPVNVAGNKLFISTKDLTTIDSQPNVGVGIFCLEPNNPEPFTVFDTTICQGNTRVYTIPKADFANGYRWEYSGNGASFRRAGTMSAFIPLTDTILANQSINIHANSIEINFGPGTTSGTLSVTPYSICNTATDYQFAKAQTINLITAPLPDLTVMDTTRLSCYSDSAYLIASSILGNAFNWNYNGLNYSNDSVLIDATNSSFTIADSIYALATVTEPINGCSSSDSTFFVVDTLAAPLPLSALSSNPSIFNCTTDSMDLIGSLAGANIEWATTAVPDSLLPNPHTIYTATPSNFIAYATYLQNGCTSQQSFLVNSDFTQADGQVNGDPNAFLTVIFDTLSCANDSLSLVAEVTSAFNGIANAEWIVGGNSIGDTLYLNTSDSLGMNSFNTNSYNLRTTHSTSGCTQDYSINIYFDLDQPLIFPDNNTYSLNCSQDSVLLDHISSGSGVTEGWIDTAGNQSYSAQYYAPVAGDYIFEVIDNVNGCSNYDTVYVTQSNELFVDLQADTLICPNDTISVTAASINNPETPSFLWSNGSTSNSIDLIGGIDSQASVIVQTPSGCIGYDTINVSITAPVDLYTSGITGCVDGILQIDSVFGGAGNYLFSLDNINWQSNSSFTGLSFGEYTVHVQDDIGCVYSFNDTIDEYDSGIQTNFLVSTYNELGDTIALVNITNFTGFDSVAWFFPFNADVIFVSDSIIELSIPDEGWHDLTLTGYTDTCYYSFTKTVYFGLNKPNFTDSTGVNGIQLVTIAPNPTTGQFNLYVEFGVAQHYSVFVTNFQGQPITGMSTSGIDLEINQDFTFPLGSPAGPYVINIISDHDAEKKTIILN